MKHASLILSLLLLTGCTWSDPYLALDKAQLNVGIDECAKRNLDFRIQVDDYNRPLVVYCAAKKS